MRVSDFKRVPAEASVFDLLGRSFLADLGGLLFAKLEAGPSRLVDLLMDRFVGPTSARRRN